MGELGMSHTLKKRYLEVRRKTARVHSGNAMAAQKLIRKLDKSGTKSSKEK